MCTLLLFTMYMSVSFKSYWSSYSVHECILKVIVILTVCIKKVICLLTVCILKVIGLLTVCVSVPFKSYCAF